MNSRERFLETMRFGHPDRVPYFEEGIRKDVLRAWHKQGLSPDANLSEMLPNDLRDEIDPDVDPHPIPSDWPSNREDLVSYAASLDPSDKSRLPANWKKQVKVWQNRQHVLMLRVNIGFFEIMGVDGWARLHELIVLMHDDPGFVREMMRINGLFASVLADRILQDVKIDAAIFGEPIGDNNGPLISPTMYEDFVLTSYQPMLEVLKQHGVDIVVLRTYANARLLIPVLLKHGIDCLWACEVNTAEMDYRTLRREFGNNLRLIGGIDLDVLRQDKAAIQRELEQKVPPLLEQGGYVPLADGRVRADISFENYNYYRKCLQKIIQA